MAGKRKYENIVIKMKIKNSHSLLSLPVLIIFFLTLLMASPAYSYTSTIIPSFDCAKATTKVEKMICSDPNLSKLDIELAKSYRDTLSRFKKDKKKLIIDNQRKWLKYRDKFCSAKTDENCRKCLEDQYRIRMHRLNQKVLGLEQLSNPFFSQTAIEKYPPYPDVWIKKIPGDALEYASLDFFKLKNSDIFISYGNKRIQLFDGALRKYGGLTFFEDNSFKYINPYVFFGKYKEYKPTDKIKFNDGTEIIVKGFETRPSRPCPITLDAYLSIKTPDGRIIEKMPVYFRDKPIQRTIDERCVDELNRSYVDKAISLAGSFVQLEDDSFLIYNRIEPTIIMRLNKEMLMKFENTFDNRVMWLDAQIIENITYNTGQLQGLHDHIIKLKPYK